MTDPIEPERPAVYLVSIFTSEEQAAKDLLREMAVPDESKKRRRAKR